MKTNTATGIRQKTNATDAAPRARQPSIRSGRAFQVLIVALTLSACDRAEAPSPPATSSASASASATPSLAGLEGTFEVVGSVEMEETDEVLTVQPMVTAGGPGELLVADPMEGQVRVYGVDGTLRANVGRKGEGPGEFEFPMTAHRTLDGGLVVADPGMSRMTFMPSDNGDSVQVADLPDVLMLAAQDMGGGRYLIAGLREWGGPGGSFLHFWNRETQEVERSFLRMRVPDELVALAHTMSGVVAVVEADTIWAAWALSDTLYKYDLEGNRLAAYPLLLPRPGSEQPQGGGATGDPASMQDRFDAVTQIMNVFPLRDDKIVIQAMQSRGNDAVFDLLIIDREGNDLWKQAGTPRLYVVADDVFYFQNPSSVHPNKWITAKLAGLATGGE